jgi:hypothetical protein
VEIRLILLALICFLGLVVDNKDDSRGTRILPGLRTAGEPRDFLNLIRLEPAEGETMSEEELHGLGKIPLRIL